MKKFAFGLRLTMLAVVLLALGSARASASQITLAWDPNVESNIAGYTVQYGPASSPFSLSADAGNHTTWTLTNAVPGTSYSFRVVAYNTNGEVSLPSDVVTTTAPFDGPALVADRSALIFGIITSGGRPVTSAQTIRLTQSGGGTITWTAVSSAAWLQISPAAGTGSGAITVTVNPATAPAANSTASITITASGATNAISPISITLTSIPGGTSKAPFGNVDTPADNTTGVTGSLAITGWALDDVDVTHVRIYRDPVGAEPAGQLIYIGDAMQIEDARPDVATAYPTYPANYRGGWGYMLLTNALPNQGNGTFRFSAYAEDSDSPTAHSTLIGSRTVTCANATSTQPFGAIDTPTQGGTASGSNYTSFGWVLSRGPRHADPPGGGTVRVLIDGIDVGTPAGWTARTDLTAAFPAAQYPGVNKALALFGFNTTTLSNGLHTMAWVVTDNLGSTQGIGSRFFRVFNGGSSLTVGSLESASRVAAPAGDIASATMDLSAIEGRRGFVADAPFRLYVPDGSGRIVVQAEELDRVELHTAGATAGYLVVGDELHPLPVGSTLDASGTFIWQPGPGFVRDYDLVFVRREYGRVLRQDVRVVLNPKGSNRVGPQVIVDITGPIVAGWAADLDSTDGSGIDGMHVWAYPVTATGYGQPIFVDVAAYGGARPDVAAVYGARFLKSGYGVSVKNLAPGTYDLALFAWSSALHNFLPAKVVRVEVK